MVAFIFNFGPYELMIVVVVAILLFGRNLPTVAVQAASVVQKMRRSLTDLRRETGIDEELRKARREFENVVPRDLPTKLDVPRIIEHEMKKALEDDEPEPDAGTDPKGASGEPSSE